MLAKTLTGLAILLILALTAGFLAIAATLALPLRIHVSGLSSEAEKRFQVIAAEDKRTGKGTLATRLFLTSYWHVEAQWIQEIVIKLPERDLPQVRELTITIGAQVHHFSGPEVASWCRLASTSQAADVLLLAPLPTAGSALPWIGTALMNWPGDVAYLHAVAQNAFIPVLVTLLAFFWWGQKRSPEGTIWSRQVLGLDPRMRVGLTSETEPAAPARDKRWNWIGLAFFAGALIFLEIAEPYYFTQCDTLNENLPHVLVGCRALWEGEFPEYNPYVLFGSPLASTGMYGLTYPPMLFCYAVARHMLGQEYATIEVFAVLHLAAGFLVTRLLCRRLGMSAMPANVVALSCVLSGASLIMGRCWVSFIPLAVWLPVVFLGLVRLCRGPATWGWVLGMGLALGLTFHVGFPQVAVYLSGFFVLAVLYLLASGELPRDRAIPVVAALILGAAIALPLVYQQWRFTRVGDREAAPSQGIAAGLPACFLPYPLAVAQLPTGWGNEHVQYLGHFYFFGGVLAFLTCFHMVGLLFFRPGRRQWAGQLWTFLTLLAGWLSLGSLGGLWQVVSMLPVFGAINRHPLRVMPFVVFFACLGGGLVLERLLRMGKGGDHPKGRGAVLHSVLSPLPNGRGSDGRIAIGLIALVLLSVHVFHWRTAFHYSDYQPYPSVPENLLEIIRSRHAPRAVSDSAPPTHNGEPNAENGTRSVPPTGRVCPWGPFSANETFGRILPSNLAAVQRLPSSEGASPLPQGTPLMRSVVAKALADPVAALRAYGVRWYLSQTADQLTPPGTALTTSWQLDVLSKSDRLFGKMTDADLVHVAEEEGVVLRELPGADPLAFWLDAKTGARRALPLRMHGWGLEADVGPLRGPGRVIVNFLRYPAMQATADGEDVPLHADAWNRIVAVLPGHRKTLNVRYAAPWSSGMVLGVATAGLGLAGAWFGLRRQRG